MALSGIKCEENVLPTYQKMSVGKTKDYRYIIYKIEKKGSGRKAEYTKVVVDKTGERNSTWQDMKDALNKDEARYIVFDLAYETASEKQAREKIIFIKFVPESSDRTEKMVYSSTEKELKQKLGTASISSSIHCDSLSEIDEEEIKSEMAKKG